MVAPPPAAPPKEDTANQVTNLHSSPATKPKPPSTVPLPAGMAEKLIKHGMSKAMVEGWKKKGVPAPMMSELYERVSHPPTPPKNAIPNPYTIDVSDNYWHHTQMGEAGIKQQRALFHKLVQANKAATMNPQPPSAP